MATLLDRPDYHSPLLQLPGAVNATGIDAGTAWHYGDPIAEQRAAETGVALFDRSNRSVLTVTGDDRLTWLHTLTSQFLNTMADGQVTEALVLSPQGHVEHHAVVTELAGVSYLDTEPGDGAGLLGYLDGMRFWSKVEVSDVSADVALLALSGPKTWDVIQRVLKVTDPGVGHAVAIPGGGFLRHPSSAGQSAELLLPRPSLGPIATNLTAAGAVPAGSWAADALRIPTRQPRWGVDIDDRTIPNEVQWLVTAVHLDKGCYRGQETVARVHNLGRPPRRLVMLNLDGSPGGLPATGDPVTTADGRVVGRLGTVAQHHEDGPIALALVKRTVDAGTPLLAGGVDAAIDPADALDDADRATPLSAIDRRALSQIRRN
jgi:folate-binding protein YgfZ